MDIEIGLSYSREPAPLWLAVHGGGKPVLPLDKLFDGIATNPAAPEYWWVYALLISSMIPSLVNLAIGGMAFTRGIPGVPRLLLQWIPKDKAVPKYKRQLTAIGLIGQMFAGAGLGPRRFSPGALSFILCRRSASTCSTWPAPSSLSTFPRGSASFSPAS